MFQSSGLIQCDGYGSGHEFAITSFGPREQRPGNYGGALLIDSAMPTYDAAIAEHIIVAADPPTTFAAARGLDLLTVHSPLLDVSMWLRGLPARLSGTTAPRIPSLIIGDDMGLPGWMFLGQRLNREIAFGAVGRFWQPTIEWRDVAAADFRGFDEPGWGKIAANFSVLRYGASATLLTYECRTVTTDPDSRRQFLRYWWPIRPVVGHIMRATLRQINTNAEASSITRTSEMMPGATLAMRQPAQASTSSKPATRQS